MATQNHPVPDGVEVVATVEEAESLPSPPLPRSTHDMVREARIQLLLRAEGIPVPEVLAVCEDESLLGVPFYVMSFMDGVVITDAVPRHLDPLEQRDATSRAAVDTLPQLPHVDVTKGDLAALGRPEGSGGRSRGSRKYWRPTRPATCPRSPHWRTGSSGTSRTARPVRWFAATTASAT